ncbi:hypothetical protein [Nonomuraea sp. NPDC048826]|uniref:hypothetical protein n=1 Tax=Nonomuraea sp. NPDC048826 TaxID=3364347 RepID=UPI00371469F8
MRVWAMVAVVALLAGGCGAGTGETAGTSPSGTAAGTDAPGTAAAATPDITTAATPTPTRTGETCNGTELLMSANGFPELRGTSADAELWGLLFAEVPFKAGAEVKIVWRMTGDGPLKVSATGPGGKRAKLVWLEDHGGSNWQRPGYEWGTGWVFPAPGCWKVELSRTRGSGHAWVRVA